MSAIWLAIPLLVGAFVLGIWLNRYVRPFAKSEVQGVKLETLLGPVLSLTVLLLAFTLVATFGSYQRAATAAAEEARKTDYLFEMGQYLPAQVGSRLQAATACYASAVAAFEWDAMAQGRTAPEVSPWTRELRATFAEIVASEDVASPVLSQALTADRDRGESRSARLTEARPTVPTSIKMILVFTAMLGILALATFTLPHVRRRVQIGALAALTTLLLVMLLAIDDVDRPYEGLVALGPTDITRVAGDLREEFVEWRPDQTLPCDEQGLPLT
jgi:hypothetical protein